MKRAGSRWLKRVIQHCQPIVFLSFFLGTNGCSILGSYEVVRKVHGREVVGPAIGMAAYEAYLRGAIAEAQKAFPQAEQSYKRAFQEHPSAEILVRIAAVQCQQGSPSTPSTFHRAEVEEPTYSLVYYEQAVCLDKQNKTKEAKVKLVQALSLEPDNVKYALFFVDLLEKLNQLPEADQWLLNLEVLYPNSKAVHEKLVRHARTYKQVGRLLRLQLAGIHPQTKESYPLQAVDDALLRSDLEQARSLAIKAHLNSGTLALRAAALGAYQPALEQADLVLAADPNNTDARVALLVSADVLAHLAGIQQGTTFRFAKPEPLSPMAGLLLSEMLLRKVGPTAGQHLLKLLPTTEQPAKDPLLLAVHQRVHKQFQSLSKSPSVPKP
jgi:Tfp pilus assembly protein PilF